MRPAESTCGTHTRSPSTAPRGSTHDDSPVARRNQYGSPRDDTHGSHPSLDADADAGGGSDATLALLGGAAAAADDGAPLLPLLLPSLAAAAALAAAAVAAATASPA